MRQYLIILLLLGLTCCAKPGQIAGDPPGEVDQEPVTEVPQDPTAATVSPSGVPQNLYQTALARYQANLKNIPNQKYLTIVDFSKWSGNPRMWIINMQTGAVEAYHVAHGTGSDPQNSGYATRFSNVPNSHESSLGFYLTAEVFQGSHGATLAIDGLDPTDSNARARAILIHGANYVYDQNVQAGRSFGCFAFPMAHRDHVLAELKGGSLVYAGLSGAK